MYPVEIIKLPRINDIRGNLTFIEECNHIPFDIKRIYFIYDVPGGEIRGAHAFKTSKEFIVAISGSFDVVINDGEVERKFHLNRSYNGLFVPAMNWRQLENFSTNALCLILTNDYYNEEDYIRDFNKIKELKNNEHKINHL